MRPLLVAGCAALLLSGCTSDAPDPAAVAASASAQASRAAAEASASAAAQAADQERLAREYPPALRATVESVYDQVQPLFDAFDAFGRPAVDNAQIRDDVFAAGGQRLALEARLRELRAAQAPDAFATRVAQLDSALAGLVQAAGTLSAATRATPGAGGVVAAYQQGEQGLDAAAKTWATAVTAVYGGTDVPLTPRRDRSGVRAPTSKGGWLFAAGQACARAGSPAAVATALPTVPLPTTEAGPLRERVLPAVAAAGTQRAGRAAAANALAEYGSSVCAEVFAVSEG